MISKELIDRINELYKKQKTLGLTDEEKEEQQALRREYLDAIKKQVMDQMGGPPPGKKGEDHSDHEHS